MDHPNVEIYKQAFPNVRLNIFQMELMEAEIEDAKVWKEAVKWWAGNGYRAESVFKVIEKYQEMKNAEYQSNSKSNIGALKQSADYFDSKYGAS